MTPDEIGGVFESWNKTDLDSYLIEITAEVAATRRIRAPESRWSM